MRVFQEDFPSILLKGRPPLEEIRLPKGVHGSRLARII